MAADPKSADYFIVRSQELAPYEDAARIWCASKDKDPDFKIKLKHPSIAGAHVFCPFWLTIAERLLDLSELMVCMRRANEKKAKTEGEPGHA
jgi:hypothetical protein